MANAKEETARIMLADGFRKPISLSYGANSISAEPGKAITVSETDARFWTSTDKFVRVAEKPAVPSVPEEKEPVKPDENAKPAPRRRNNGGTR